MEISEQRFSCLRNIDMNNPSIKYWTPKGNNWVTGIFEGHRFQAKIFGGPSETYGLNAGRVSKLTILKLDNADWSAANTLFLYDREMIIDNPIGHRFAEIIDSEA
jgi:hypothetical protein